MKKQVLLLSFLFLFCNILLAQIVNTFSSLPHSLTNQLPDISSDINITHPSLNKFQYNSELQFNNNNTKDFIWIMDSAHTFKWDLELTDWTKLIRTDYSYNGNGNQTLGVSYFWDTATNAWLNYTKYLFTYDDNFVIEEIDYKWDADLNDWLETYKNNYTNDENGNRLEDISYTWKTELSDWLKTYKYIFTYNYEGKVTSQFAYNWKIDLNDWLNSWKRIYYYDDNGNMTEREFYSWDSNINEWNISSKNTYTYDDDDRLETDIYYSWDTELNNWIPSVKNEYTYEIQITNAIRYNWSTVLNDWNISYKSIFTFDENGNQKGYTYYSWDNEINDWVNVYKADYFWSGIVNINEVAKTKAFKVFPNPSNGVIKIKLNNLIQETLNVKLYNTENQIVYSDILKPKISTVSISFPELPAGVYFLQIDGQGHSDTKIIIIE